MTTNLNGSNATTGEGRDYIRGERDGVPARRRDRRSCPAPHNRPRQSYRATPRAMLAMFGTLTLLSSYILPAYSSGVGAPPSDTGTNLAALSSEGESQAFQAPVGVDADPLQRDEFQVTRTTLTGFEPYAHLAATFSNNPNSSFQWPFDVGVPIGSGFGYRECRGCSANHQGLDMNPGKGTPIEAIGAGTVVEVGNPSGTFGVYAIIEHNSDGQRFTSLYAHMLTGSLALSVGEVVTAGTLVGQVGSTGKSTGPHLHFGIYLNGTTAVDPYAFMKQKVGS